MSCVTVRRNWVPRPTQSGNDLHRIARLLSLAASAGDETVRAQMRLVLQLSRLARAVAELREAQRHAAQAAAARQAAEELRAAWRASTSWSAEELASAPTVAERNRMEFPFPPGIVRPETEHWPTRTGLVSRGPAPHTAPGTPPGAGLASSCAGPSEMARRKPHRNRARASSACHRSLASPGSD